MIYLHCNIGQQVRSWTRTVAARTRPVRSLVYSVGSTLDLSKLISFKICWSWMLFCRSCPDFERIKADGHPRAHKKIVLENKTAEMDQDCKLWGTCVVACCHFNVWRLLPKVRRGPQRCDLSEGDVSGSMWQYVAVNAIAWGKSSNKSDLNLSMC